MGIDNSTLLRQTATDIVRGLRSERGAFADIVCTKKERASIKGSEPYLATKDLLGRDVAGEAIGSDPTFVNTNLSSIDWDMLRYHRGLDFDNSQLIDLSQYFDAVAEYAEILMAHVDTGIDLDLVGLLEDSNFNTSQAAGNGNWSANTSTPAVDMQNLKNKVPGADTCIIGLQTAQELARHEDMKGAADYYANQGAMPMGALRGRVAETLSIDPGNVFIMANFYDSANQGQALSLSYTSGSELFWVGTRRALVMVEQPAGVAGVEPSNLGEFTVETKHKKTELVYSRTLDLIRPDSVSGGYMTGI